MPNTSRSLTACLFSLPMAFVLASGCDIVGASVQGEADAPEHPCEGADPESFAAPGEGGGPGGGQGHAERIERAKKACEGKSEGGTCSVQTPHGAKEGSCQTKREVLVCVPKGHEKREGMRQKAKAACEGKAADASCTMTTPRGEMSGSCKDGPEGLMCRPARGPGGGPPPQ